MQEEIQDILGDAVGIIMCLNAQDPVFGKLHIVFFDLTGNQVDLISCCTHIEGRFLISGIGGNHLRARPVANFSEVGVSCKF